MSHLGDTNKMSDTPRTEAEVNRQKCWSDDLIFACQLERELNAATSEVERLRKANLQLREGAEEQKQLIKRLIVSGDALFSHAHCTNYHEKVAEWNEAKRMSKIIAARAALKKEAKP